MKKSYINLSAGIFSVVYIAAPIMCLFLFLGGGVSGITTFSFATLLITFLILGIIVMFILGILQLVNANNYMRTNGAGIAAGIMNILIFIWIWIPIFNILIFIAAIICSFIAQGNANL